MQQESQVHQKQYGKDQSAGQISSHIQKVGKKVSELPKGLQPGITSVFSTVKNLFKISIPSEEVLQIIASLEDTLRKATEPQINSYVFETGFNCNLYPVFGIIAWKNQQFGYNLIDWRLCSFVESGGVRCIPILQSDLEDPKNLANLKAQLENLHGLVIPQFYQQTSAIFFEKLLESLNDHQKDLFVLSFGNSSNFILAKNHQTIFKQSKPKNGLIQGRLIHTPQSVLLKDINISIQLRILSNLINYPVIQFPQFNLVELSKISNISIESYLISALKENELAPWLLKQKISETVTIYHSFIQLYDQSCSKGFEYFNKAIINFVNLTKEKLNNVKKPTKFVAHYPLEFKQTALKAHYKIVSTQTSK